MAAFTATARWMIGTSPAYPLGGGNELLVERRSGADVDGHLFRVRIRCAAVGAQLAHVAPEPGESARSTRPRRRRTGRAVFARSTGGKLGVPLGIRIRKFG